MFGLLSAAGESSGSVSSFLELVKNAFSGFGINDVVDIVLLALIFTFAFRFFKDKKAGALIAGIFICLAVYILATLFDLTGIKFLLSGIFQIGALAFVIIFQPEIRDFLERVGSGSLKGISSLGDKNHKKQLQYKVIDNICKAVQILAVEKTGALIAIEKTTNLDDILHSGTTINSDVSDALLRNIFYNRAPLHDGAVIIQDAKIAAASCILPLPRRTDVDPDLGTRHRAAIGLSEVSDALIIIVSEETGIISLAKECTLTRNFTAESLKKTLIKELVKDAAAEEENN